MEDLEMLKLPHKYTNDKKADALIAWYLSRNILELVSNEIVNYETSRGKETQEDDFDFCSAGLTALLIRILKFDLYSLNTQQRYRYSRDGSVYKSYNLWVSIDEQTETSIEAPVSL